MKLHKLALALALLTAMPMRAQTRILTGANVGIDFNNESAGFVVGIEQPITKHFEADLYDIASPIESHLGLGTGTANLINAGGIAWATKTIGLTAQLKSSRYDVTDTSKNAYYLQPGLVFRIPIQDSASRLSVLGAHQLYNGVRADGTESSHLNGFSLVLDSQVSCTKHTCIRLKEQFDTGHILEQGNPANDSRAAAAANGQTYHPRTGAWSGGFTFTFLVTFEKDTHANTF